MGGRGVNRAIQLFEKNSFELSSIFLSILIEYKLIKLHADDIINIIIGDSILSRKFGLHQV